MNTMSRMIRRFVAKSDREFTVRALTPIADFNEYFGTAFSDEEYDTIGGLLMQEFGRLPRRGETIQIGELEFRILRADRRRIDLLRVITPSATSRPLPTSRLLEGADARPRCRVSTAVAGAPGGRLCGWRRSQPGVCAGCLVADGVLAPAALFALIRGVPPRRALRIGAAFGAGLFAFGTYWLYTCLHTYGLVPVWLTIVLQTAAGRLDVGVSRCALLPGEPLLAEARADSRLAGAAGLMGAAGMAARLGAQRLSLAVAGLRASSIPRSAAGRRCWASTG